MIVEVVVEEENQPQIMWYILISSEHGMVCGLQPPQQVQQPQQHYNNRINGKAPQFFSSFYAYLFF